MCIRDSAKSRHAADEVDHILDQQYYVNPSNGQKSTISFVSDEQPDLLRYLSSLGLLPETAVSVEDIAPFGGPLLVRVGRARYALGREVAGKIFVRA